MSRTIAESEADKVVREMAERLRREHTRCDSFIDEACDCGADAHNAQVAALIAAIDEEMRRLAMAICFRVGEYGIEKVHNRDAWFVTDGSPYCNTLRRDGTWIADEDDDGSSTYFDSIDAAFDALSAHRARRGGQ